MEFANENGVSTIFLEGSINSQNVYELEKDIKNILAVHPGEKTVLDASSLRYISSSGLRLLIKLQKDASDPITICEVSPEVYEIFDMTVLPNSWIFEKRCDRYPLKALCP